MPNRRSKEIKGGSTQRRATLTSASLLVAALVLGVGLGFLVMPGLFQRVETDLVRTGVLLRTLENPPHSPELVVLGNSVAMYAIDVGRLTPADTMAGLNLGSHEQSLAESFLYLQELPASVETVLQVVVARQLLTSRSLPAQRFNAFYMYGYRPDAKTRSVLAGIYGEPMAQLLDRSALRQRFAARWVLRQLLDTRMRQVLRPELDLVRAQRELYAPQLGGDALSARKRERLIRRWIEEMPLTSFDPEPRKLALLSAIADGAEAGGREVVLLLPPVQPVVRAARGDGFYDELRRVLATRLSGRTLLDATDLLPEDEFVDHLHPTREGGVIWSDWIAANLGGDG